MANNLPDYGDPEYCGGQPGRGPDNLYIDVMSSDGVSTITGPLGHDDFDPVGIYLPPEASNFQQVEEPIYEDQDYDDGYFDDDEHQNHPHAYMEQDEDFDPHSLGPTNIVAVSGYIPPKDVDNLQGSFGATGPPPNHEYTENDFEDEENMRDEYAGRLEGWYNQMEQLTVQGDSATQVGEAHSSLRPTVLRPTVSSNMGSQPMLPPRPHLRPTGSSNISSQPILPPRPGPPPPPRPNPSLPQRPAPALPPKPAPARPPRPAPARPPRPAPAPPKQPAIASRRGEGTRRLLICLVVVLILVVVALGVGMAAVIFLTDILPFGPSDDEDGGTKDAALFIIPTISPMDLTITPTSSPTPGELELKLVRSFDGPDGFGLRVAMSFDYVAIGSSSGVVDTFASNNTDESWEDLPVLNGPSNSAFGFDVVVASLADENNTNAGGILLIGSPEHGSDTQGATFLYRYDKINNIWQMQGEPLLGSNATKENFGYSLAMSRNTLLAVIGAPGYNSGSGRLYTFLLRDSNNDGVFEATRILSNPINGLAPNARLGEAVDITHDGSTIAVGEPGQNHFSVYSWDDGDWKNTYSHFSPSNTKAFGSSVVFLSERYVAVGDPKFDISRGAVQVFKKNDEGSGWASLAIIVGSVGDRLGALRSVSGKEDAGPQLVLGTSNGFLKRYDWVGGNWVPRFSSESSGPVTSVTSLTETDGRFSILAGFSSISSAFLYEGVFSSSPVSVTSAQTTASKRPTVPAGSPSPSPSSVPSSPTSSPSSPPSSPSTSSSSSTPSSSTSSPSTTPSPSSASKSSASPSPSLTAFPSLTPTNPPKWTIVAGPLTSSINNTFFGSALAVVDDFLLVGGPKGAGNVTAFQRSTDWGVELSATVQTLKFGFSIDAAMVAGRPSVVVGAIETRGGAVRYGSAHYFQYESQGWSEVGGTMLPFRLITEAGGEFGSSVALAPGIQRVVVGAQDSSLSTGLLNCGRVYTFELVYRSWSVVADMAGSRASMFLGASIDITFDGSKLLVGAPLDYGGDGSVFLYEWAESDWNQVFSLRAPNASLEGLGTQVAFLTEDGETFAVGAPNHKGDQGIIRVFEQTGSSYQESANVFEQIGSSYQESTNIVGLPGERIGNTLSGASGRIGYGTDTGTFYVIAKENNGWEEIGSVAPFTDGSPVVSITMSGNANTVAVGLASEEVFVLELE